jgi:hypothetical protein
METVAFALGGAGIRPVFSIGRTLYVGRPAILRAHAVITTAPGSTLGQVVFKWQGIIDDRDPDGWGDVASMRDDMGVPEREHTFDAPAGSKLAHGFNVDVRGFRAMRLLGRSTSGVGVDGDGILVQVVPW